MKDEAEVRLRRYGGKTRVEREQSDAEKMIVERVAERQQQTGRKRDGERKFCTRAMKAMLELVRRALQYKRARNDRRALGKWFPRARQRAPKMRDS